MRQKLKLLLLCFFSSFMLLDGFSQSVSEPLPTDPGRVQVQETTGYGGPVKTVVTSEGELLRGAMFITGHGRWRINRKTPYIFQEEYYKMLADSGINAVRVAPQDPNINDNPNSVTEGWPVVNMNDPKDKQIYLEHLDSIVDLCSKYGLYVILNPHAAPGGGDNVCYDGSFRKTDDGTNTYWNDWWEGVAPYFKDRTHVVYDLLNEPVWLPCQMTNAQMDHFVEIFKTARDAAPNTHIMHFSFSGVRHTFCPSSFNIKDAVDKFVERASLQGITIDWTKNSVAFHPYKTGGTEDWLWEVMTEYPALSTESNFAPDEYLSSEYLSILQTSSQRSDPFDPVNEIFVTETFEKIGVSWIHFAVDDIETIEGNYYQILLDDAKNQGYKWFGAPEHEVNVSYNSSQGTVTPQVSTVYDGGNLAIEAKGNLGYKFSHWSGDVGKLYAVTTDNPNRLENITGDINITAHFVSCPTYTISTTVEGNGEIKVKSGPFNEGEKVLVWAEPEGGYRNIVWKFDSWSGDITHSDVMHTFTMDGNKNITAKFVEKTGQEIKVWAAGKNGIEQMAVTVEDAIVPGAKVNVGMFYNVGGNYFSGEYVEYRMVVDNAITPISADQIRVRYQRDGSDEVSGALFVDKISLDGVEYETETDNTISTGTWTGTECGDNNSEVLNCENTEHLYGQGDLSYLTVDNGGGGTTDPSGQTTYSDGEVVSVSAEHGIGYRFDEWTGQIGSATATDNPVDITMDQDRSITATWTTVPTYDIDSVISPAGSGSVEYNETNGVYEPGMMATVTAKPVAGYVFVEWTGDIGGVQNPLEIDMQSDLTLTANYAPAEILQTSTVPGIDGIRDDAWVSARYPLNNVTDRPENITGKDDLSANWSAMWDNDYLYVIAEVTDDVKKSDSDTWWKDDGVEIYIDADNSKTENYGNEDFQFGFNYGDKLTEAKHGTTTGVRYVFKDTENGYVFEAKLPWSTLGTTPAAGNLVGIDLQVGDDDAGNVVDSKIAAFATENNAWMSPQYFGAMKLVSSLSASQYELTLDATGTTVDNVFVSPVTNGTSFFDGQNVELEALDVLGYAFDSWSGSINDITNPVSFTMDADKDITANYNAVSTYDLSTNLLGGGGSIDLSDNAGTFNDGSDVTLTAIDEPGYAFDSWSGNIGGANSTDPSITVTMDMARSITANFTTATTYTLDVNENINGGAITLDPSGGVYNSGQDVTVTLDPYYAFTFDGWSGDLSGSQTTEVITMNGNKSITASYTEQSINKSTPLATDPARVKIETNQYGMTVVTADGEKLRGGEVGWWTARHENAPEQLEFMYEESYYQTLADSGHNALRVRFFDPWSNSNDDNAIAQGLITNFDDPAEVDTLLKYMNTIIDNASKYGLHVILNYHDVGKYTGDYLEPDAETIGYLRDVWNTFAPYYRDRTHVIYQLVNEPEFGASWGTAIIDSMAYMYEMVHNLAPETHIMNFGFSGAIGKSYTDETMYDVLNNFEARHPGLIDWSNASIGFHPYTDNLDYTSDAILKTMAKWPVVNEEANFPKVNNFSPPIENKDKQYQQVDGELFINQTMERLGISWMNHQVSGDAFDPNWTIILNDARAKDYIWFDESTGNLLTQHEVIAENNEEQGTVFPPGGYFIDGSVKSFEARPKLGYKFDSWSGDLGGASSTANPVDITINGNKAITANFTTTNTYTISTETEITGAGVIQLRPTGGEYNEGDEVMVVVKENPGFTFDGWSGSSTETNDTIMVTMNSDKNLTANFSTSLTLYTLTTSVESGIGGSVNPQGTTYYDDGSLATITAEAIDGYHFSHWSGASNATNATVSLTMNSNKMLTANFAANVSYDLTTVADGNNGTITPSGGSFFENQVIDVEAEGNLGYGLDYWDGDIGIANNTDNPISITMTSDKSLTAYFKTVPTYDLITNANGEGNIVSDPTGGTYNEGTSVSLTAEAIDGYQFDNWSGDLGGANSTDNPVAITMDSDKSITANFSIEKYTLTVSSSPSEGGSTSKNPDLAEYNDGDVVTVTATETEGYTFTGWSGASTSTETSVDITMNNDETLTANFAINTYTLTTNVLEGNGMLNKNPDQTTYDHGTTVSVSAVPEINYEFVQWSGASTETTNPVDVVMDDNKSISASFELMGIDYASTIPTIDGSKESAWTGVDMDIAKNNLGTVTSDADLSGTWSALWDNDNLYVIVEVTDDQLTDDSETWWKDDVVEVYIDADNSKSTTYDANDFQYVFEWNGGILETKSNATTNVEYSITDVSSGYVVEAKFPWSTLGVTPAESDLLGIEIMLNDDDDGGEREGKKAWYGTDDVAWSDPSTFGELILNSSSAPVQYTLTTSATDGDITLSPTGGTYDANTTVTATANADAGYYFTDWDGASENTTSPVDITMDADKSLTANFSPILVNSITIPEGDQSLEVGENYQFTVDITPSDALDQSVTWEVSSGSAYASVDANGLVTADAAGTATITATANDASGESANVEVTVTDTPNGQSPYGGTPWTIPGQIEAEDYDEGGENIAFYDATSGNSGGQYRTDNVDVQTTSDAGGGYNVGWTSNGEWLEYTVDVASTSTYKLEIRSAGTGTGTIEISFNDGAVSTGDITLPSTGAWQTWTTVEVTGLSLSAGEQVMRIDLKSGGFNMNYVNIVEESNPTQESMSFVQSASYDMEGARLHSTWCSDCNYGSAVNFILNNNYSHFILGVDISSIPSNATIDSVELTVYNSKTLYGGSSVSHEVRAITASFDEDVVTYDAFNSSIDGTSTGLYGTLDLTPPGGSPQTDAALVLEGNTNMVDAAQAALDGSGFFGLAVLTDPNQALDYHSDDAGTASLRPVIRVVYTTLSSAEAGLEGTTASASMKLYPNPTSSNAGLNVELKGFEDETNATISIMDISGRIAYSTNVQTMDRSVVEQSLNTNGLASGMYMVVVRSNNKTINQRLIVR